MSFVDILRTARQTRIAVLHEFLAQHDPKLPRIHAFFEGHDDISIIRPTIERHLSADTKLFVYRCDGKSKVYEAFKSIVTREPNIKVALFFVDKDLDDILGVPLITDPRIYVTDFYSVENYVVSLDVFRAFYDDAIRTVGVTFDFEAIAIQFDLQLKRYQKAILLIMAWVIAIRRSGVRPNLSNVQLNNFFRINNQCELEILHVDRLKTLCQSTGVASSSTTFRRVAPIIREISRLPPKRVIRGKFEAWFLVEFWKRMVENLRSLAGETGGKVEAKMTLEHSTLATVLARYLPAPESLNRFLVANIQPAPVLVVKAKSNFFKRLLGL